MHHTPEIKKAFQFAARKHHGQMRHGAEPLPYITHLFSVALLVAEDGAHDDVITAALLHDTIEDTDTTYEEIVTAFNERVADLVDSVSERKEIDGRNVDWKERKMEYLARLEHSSRDTLLIAIADKVDNVESWNEGLEKEGQLFFTYWRQPNGEYLWFYGEALRIAQQRLPDHLLTKRYGKAYQIFARSLGSR